MAIDIFLQKLYVADAGNAIIRVIDLNTEQEPHTLPDFFCHVLCGLMVLALHTYFKVDQLSKAKRACGLRTNEHETLQLQVSTIAGSAGTRGFVDATGGAATFMRPLGLALDVRTPLPRPPFNFLNPNWLGT